MKFTITTLLSALLFTYSFGQTTFRVTKTLEWSDKKASFEGAVFSKSSAPNVPVFNYRFPMDANGRIAVEVADAQFAPLSTADV